MTSTEFAEIVARYFGVASPACAGLIGQSIGTTRQRFDPHGARLTAAWLPGDGFRKQHDTIKWRLSEDMREMGVRSRTEVYGLFAALLPQSAQDEVAKWPRRKRQGLVPDFVAAIPDELHTPAEVVDELFELKTLHYGSTTYPSGSDARCAAVTRRAEAIPGEQAAKARRLDQEFCGATPGEIGPVGRKLAAFGPVRGLVFRHWAEASGHVDALLAGCAQCGAQRHWMTMQARDPEEASSSLASLLRRRWGMTAWKAAARLLLDRLEYIGHGANAARMRREAAWERAATARRTSHWLFSRPRRR